MLEIAIRHERTLVARAHGPRQLYECVELPPEEACAEINVGPIEPERAHALEAEVIDDGVRGLSARGGTLANPAHSGLYAS